MRKIALLLVSFLIILNMNVFAVEVGEEKIYFYVSPEGSDSNCGSIDSPFATFEGARDAIRNLKKEQGLPQKGEVVVYFREGIYKVDETIKLDSQDSGTEDCPITYSSYPGERATISSGYYVETSSFQNVVDKNILDRLSYGAKKNVRAVNLKRMGITDYGHLTQSGDQCQLDTDDIYGMQVYVGNNAYDLARWPNRDADGMAQYVKTNKIIKSQDGYTTGRNSSELAIFTVYDETAARMASWGTLDDVWIEGSMNWVYFSASFPIDTMDFSSNTLSVRGGAYGGYANNKPFYFMNCLDELDTPGEYYIDRENGILYIYPDDNFDNGETVKLSGYCGMYILEAYDNANYLNFNGLTFELSRRHAVSVDRCSFVNITDCFFGNSTGMGLFVGERSGWGHSSPRANFGNTDEELFENGLDFDTHDINIVSCRFENTGDGGVRAAGGNDASLTPANIKILNCYTRRCDISNKTYAPGIGVWGCGIEVRNNFIEYQSHSAVNWGGAEIVFTNNEVYDILREYADMGAFYTSKGSITSIIKNNYVHNMPLGELHASQGVGEYHRMLDTNTFCHNKVAFYFDGCAPGGTVINNVVQDGIYGIQQGSWEAEIKGNIFIDIYYPYQLFGNHSATAALNSGKKWYEGNAQTFWQFLSTKDASIWKEKYPYVFDILDDINKDLEENGKITKTQRQYVEDNIHIYDKLIDTYDKYYRFGDLSLFNSYTKTNRTSYMEDKTNSILNNEKGGGTFINNETFTTDIGFLDYKNGNYTLKENAEILKTHPSLANIKMNEISLVNDNLSDRIKAATVFKVGSPKVINNGKETVLDDNSIETETILKSDKAFITAEAYKNLFDKDYEGTGLVSLDEIAENINLKLYEKDGLYVLYSGDNIFDDNYEYDNTLVTVLAAQMK